MALYFVVFGAKVCHLAEVVALSAYRSDTTNLSNRNYAIEDGYHAPGRQYFANLRVTC